MCPSALVVERQYYQNPSSSSLTPSRILGIPFWAQVPLNITKRRKMVLRSFQFAINPRVGLVFKQYTFIVKNTHFCYSFLTLVTMPVLPLIKCVSVFPSGVLISNSTHRFQTGFRGGEVRTQNHAEAFLVTVPPFTGWHPKEQKSPFLPLGPKHAQH